jgi:putative copper resistance protein D
VVRSPIARQVSRRIVRFGASLAVVATAAVGLPGAILAHGPEVPGEPTLASFLLGWSFDPLVWLPIAAASVLWIVAVQRVDRAHPRSVVPAQRTICFLAAMATLLVALASGIERYDTTLFSVHMVQHILITLVAAPLIVLAGPITLLLRVVRPEIRRTVILPILHSRPVRVLTHPVVAWLIFAGVMWTSHFSPLFDAALEDEWIHRFEHVLFLAAALLFWWPAIGVDPVPGRMRHPARALYVGLQMPQNTFLSLALLSATAVLYPHYATNARDWPPTPLADQQLAAGIMWVVGDLIFIGVVLAIVAGWMRHEEAATRRADERADAARVAIRERETRLAERRAAEGGQAAGSGEASSVR